MQRGIVSFKTWSPALFKGNHDALRKHQMYLFIYSLSILVYSTYQENLRTNSHEMYHHVLITALNSIGVASKVFKLTRTMTGTVENSGIATVRIVCP